ncbi:uncharacterized protein LOC126985018 isoform X2 [Eriocheir sinensis]|nr:uncharacterized protein LOC126985018 isoform X2 [Eriocheir sinensis]
MAWLVAATVLAAVVSVARADAGHFFAETPKHLPRIGRRGDLPPLTTLLTEEDARSPGATTRGMTEALAGLGLDSDGDGCIGLGELVRNPVVRVALLLQNPALLNSAAPASSENDGELRRALIYPPSHPALPNYRTQPLWTSYFPVSDLQIS